MFVTPFDTQCFVEAMDDIYGLSWTSAPQLVDGSSMKCTHNNGFVPQQRTQLWRPMIWPKFVWIWQKWIIVLMRFLRGILGVRSHGLNWLILSITSLFSGRHFFCVLDVSQCSGVCDVAPNSMVFEPFSMWIWDFVDAFSIQVFGYNKIYGQLTAR